MLGKIKRILVPVDGSPTSDKALATAIELAGETGASIRLIHSVEHVTYTAGLDFNGQALPLLRREAGERILGTARAAAHAAGIAADSRLIDHPGERLGEAVADAAKDWQADLIVVGTHGRHGVGRVLLGSGAEQIVRLAPVPVLVIRGESAHGATGARTGATGS